jgi:uncharacterized protein (TIGR03437 family)
MNKPNVTVRIGGVDAKVEYAGAAPGLVSGILQVNARLPESLVGIQPVQLTVGGVNSQPGVVVAVANVGQQDGTAC